MTMTLICEDTDHRWLTERRKLITASDIAVFTGTAPKFWSDTREELIARKLEGRDKEFDDKAKRRTAHGRLREATHLSMLGRLLGFPVVPFHWLVSNDRWPLVGATLDGLLFPWMQVEPDLTLTSKPARVDGDVIDALQPGSTGRCWWS